MSFPSSFSVKLGLLLLGAIGVPAADSVRDEYNRAWQLVGQRKPNEAIPLLEAIIEKDPSFHRAYQTIVDAYKQKKALDQAERYFRQLLGKDGRIAYAHYGLGKVYGLRFQFGLQAKEYSACIALEPHALVCYLSLPNSMLESRNKLPTVVDLRSRIKLNPEHPFACIGFAKLFFIRREIPRALETAKSCLAKAMKSADLELLAAAHRALEDAYVGASNLDKALVHAQEDLSLMVSLDDWEGQLSAMERVAGENGVKGDTQQRLKVTERSLETVRRLGHREWLHIDLANLGAIQLSLGDPEEALRYLWQAYRGFVEDEHPYQLNTLESIAAVYHRRGDFVAARPNRTVRVRSVNQVTARVGKAGGFCTMTRSGFWATSRNASRPVAASWTAKLALPLSLKEVCFT